MGVKGLGDQGDFELNQLFLTSLCDWTKKNLHPLSTNEMQNQNQSTNHIQK